MRHEISGTVTRSHDEKTERVQLACTCGVKIPAYRRRANVDSPVRDAAGFLVPTDSQTREMEAQAHQAHARAGVAL